MKRLAFVALAFFVLSPVWAEDIVYYTDRATKKDDQVKGVIDQESPAGVKVKVGRAVKDVPATDINQIVYGHKDVSAIEFRRPFTKETNALKATRAAERADLLKEALLGYQELDGKMRDTPHAHRYLQYKIAQVTALQVQGDPSRRDAAIEALKTYKTEHGTGWEIVPALKLLARLQEEKGDAEGASQAYADLADVPGLPEATQRESQFMVARLLLSGHKYAEAERRLKAVQAKMPKDDPQRALVDVYLVQTRIARNDLNGVEDELKKAVAAGDPDKLPNEEARAALAAVRGVAHNCLGDYYRLRNQPEPAFWEYLKVDTLYSQDKEEEAKALYYLAELFDKVKNDKVRAAECLTRLKGAAYAGTLYQRLAAEKKTP
jgi:hypothetical protein